MNFAIFEGSKNKFSPPLRGRSAPVSRRRPSAADGSPTRLLPLAAVPALGAVRGSSGTGNGIRVRLQRSGFPGAAASGVPVHLLLLAAVPALGSKGGSPREQRVGFASSGLGVQAQLLWAFPSSGLVNCIPFGTCSLRLCLGPREQVLNWGLFPAAVSQSAGAGLVSDW